jgi:hypothetical protein
MGKYRKWIVAGLVAASLVPQALKLFLPTGKMLYAFFPDDCFYYYRTALNIAAGTSSTFDGINFTNGYHPLWMLVCVAIAAISCPSGRAFVGHIVTGLAILVGAVCPRQSIYFYNVYHYSPIMYDAAIWMRTNLPRDAKVGIWNARVISYFSQRTVINLDGVINGTELYEYQRRSAIYEYITDHNIQYIGDVYTTSPGPEHSVIKDRLKRVYVSEDRIQDAKGNAAVARYYTWQIE